MRANGLHQIAVRTTDLDASIAFYRDIVEIPFIARFDPPGIAFFDAGGTRLMLSADAPAAQIYFLVDDLDAAHAEISALGHIFEGGPVMVHRDDRGQFAPSGTEEWMSFLRDPSGNLIGLVERRRPVG